MAVAARHWAGPLHHLWLCDLRHLFMPHGVEVARLLRAIHADVLLRRHRSRPYPFGGRCGTAVERGERRGAAGWRFVRRACVAAGTGVVGAVCVGSSMCGRAVRAWSVEHTAYSVTVQLLDQSRHRPRTPASSIGYIGYTGDIRYNHRVRGRYLTVTASPGEEKASFDSPIAEAAARLTPREDGADGEALFCAIGSDGEAPFCAIESLTSWSVITQPRDVPE